MSTVYIAYGKLHSMQLQQMPHSTRFYSKQHPGRACQTQCGLQVKVADPIPVQALYKLRLRQVAGGVGGQHHTAAEGHKMLVGNGCLLANTLAMAIFFITAKQLSGWC